MIGDVVENFVLNDQYGKKFNLYDNLTNKVLLIFYPKDNSPVCSMQMNDYTKNLQIFEKNNISLIGINSNSENEHLNFCNNLRISFPLLVDSNKQVTKKFNALTILGTTKRKLVLINTDRKIIFEKNTLSLFYLNTSKILDTLRAQGLIS
jgi:peroxiredoxin